MRRADDCPLAEAAGRLDIVSKRWAEIMPLPGLTDPSWGRQKGETAKAHKAFTLYRNADPRERSWEQAARDYSCSRSQIAEWSKRYRWSERVDRWDQHAERLALAAQEDGIREMNQRHVGFAITMLQKVLQRLVGDDVENVRALDPSLLSPADCARLSEVAVKIERLARGSETERIGLDAAAAPVSIKLSFDAQPNFVGENPGMRAGMIDYSPQRELPPAA
jgi:hypothetical protein